MGVPFWSLLALGAHKWLHVLKIWGQRETFWAKRESKWTLNWLLWDPFEPKFAPKVAKVLPEVVP